MSYYIFLLLGKEGREGRETRGVRKKCEKGSIDYSQSDRKLIN